MNGTAEGRKGESNERTTKITHYYFTLSAALCSIRSMCVFMCVSVWNNVNTNSMQKSEHSKNANSKINEVLNACCNQLINILKSILRVRSFPSIKLSRSLTHAHTLFPPLPPSSLYSLKMSRILNLFLSLHSNIMLPFQNASASTDDFSIL